MAKLSKLDYFTFNNQTPMRTFTLVLLLMPMTLFAQIDANATCETVALYQRLQTFAGNQLLFGHENSTYEGIGWQDPVGTTDQSDVFNAIGDFPAVYGFDFIDGYGTFYEHVRRAYRRGGIITISDHMDNPATSGDSWDTGGNAVSKILTIGSNEHIIYNWYLDQAANFFLNIKEEGIHIPIIYRPLHENSGNWFWWGKNQCTPAEFVQLWQYTVSYLRDTKGVHNVLYAYSPSRPSTDGGYGSRYPGDDWVDILGFDYYQGSSVFASGLIPDCQLVVNLANQKNKIAALTEFGIFGGIQNTLLPDWFRTELLNPIKNDPIAKQIVWALTWRNGTMDHHWVPVSGENNFISFVNFANDPYTAFESDLPADLYDCSNITSNTALAETSYLRLYPNPAQNHVNLEIDRPFAQGQLTLFDLSGKRILDHVLLNPATTISLGQLPAGVYAIRIQLDGEAPISQSLIIQ
ncbi:glycosyl hydrolase [Pontibacter sp. G13]|uniref:glycosyl hydrolase n=1 Tax=Pontibacter sp. G13 TaxID=3074898 RepID=UPI002889B160|nr:glycosyl hydrolase [Pontibacter sp. G13]WNJ21070.1 glycosyl hydrolase [Pontibacter sp. G13]